MTDPASLVATFVSAGPLFELLRSRDHQVLFGRRGTGKTHALTYLAEEVRDESNYSLVIDMRSIGSTGGLYNDPTASFAERGTRLLIDVLEVVQDRLVDLALGTSLEEGRGHSALIHLDRLADELSSIRVVGDVEIQDVASSTSATSDDTSLGGELGPTGPRINAGTAGTRSTSASDETRVRRSGVERHRVHVGAVRHWLEKTLEDLGIQRLWLIIDEWSSVPLDLQPFLADMLRRSFMPIRRITLKIAAIEHRTAVKLATPEGDYIGFELGADIAADLDLDDFMVFDNDESKAKAFFGELFRKHLALVSQEEGLDVGDVDGQREFIREAFTQINAFEELVRAAEGVPRDAINVGIIAAQRADEDRIGVPHVRTAAKSWYQRDKESSATADEKARALLVWIIDGVIGERRAKAFMLRQGPDSQNPLIRSLYDNRVLHLIKKGVSSRDEPGVRYNVFAIDYGCYVDLILTTRAPQGLLPVDGDGGDLAHITVPQEDYRSIRRAILDLDEFERQRIAPPM
jgi:hypothetical protein